MDEGRDLSPQGEAPAFWFVENGLENFVSCLPLRSSFTIFVL